MVLRKTRPGKDKLKRKWEGPFEIVDYDEKMRGYKLKEVVGGGRVLKTVCPIERLKVCTEAFSTEEEDGVRYEVDRVTDHGEFEGGSMLYRVKWSGYKELTWEPGCNLEDRTIKDYWITKGETFGYADEMARKAREQEKEVRRKKANTSS